MRADEKRTTVLVDTTVSVATAAWHGSRKAAGRRVNVVLENAVVTGGDGGYCIGRTVLRNWNQNDPFFEKTNGQKKYSAAAAASVTERAY